MSQSQPSKADERPFSEQLELWLREPGPKTIGALTDVIEEKSFALVLMLLLFIPALPVPTGGVTTIFELVAMLVAVQLIVGRKELWLPKRVMRRELGPATTGKAIPFIVRRVRWFERFARPRFEHALERRAVRSVIGVVVLVFIGGSFVAPPFSGLDTLPALGVVIVSLGILFGDALILGLGCAVGSVGVGLEIALGSTLWRLF